MPKTAAKKTKPTTRTAASSKRGGQLKSAGKASRKKISSTLVKPYHRLKGLRKTRIHKSFSKTDHRDTRRATGLPGYWSFTARVTMMLWRNRALFLSVIIAFSVLAMLLGGLSSKDTYNQLGDMFREETQDGFGSVSQAFMLSATLITSGPISEVQQFYLLLMGIMTWLTTVWLLRELMAGNNPKFRDGLYNAGAPLMATIVVALFALIQLIPAGILSLAYSALSQTGYIDEGLGALLFFGLAALVLSLTLYWLTSTFFALSIITLPGMYPWRAMRAASDVVINRRLKILFRLLWALLMITLAWVVLLVPFVIFDQWIGSKIDWWASIGIIPILTVILTTSALTWMATYVYLMYRKVVAEDAK